MNRNASDYILLFIDKEQTLKERGVRSIHCFQNGMTNHHCACQPNAQILLCDTGWKEKINPLQKEKFGQGTQEKQGFFSPLSNPHTLVMGKLDYKNKCFTRKWNRSSNHFTGFQMLWTFFLILFFFYFIPFSCTFVLLHRGWDQKYWNNNTTTLHFHNTTHPRITKFSANILWCKTHRAPWDGYFIIKSIYTWWYW